MRLLTRPYLVFVLFVCLFGFFFFFFLVDVRSHVCLLKKRLDPSRGGTLRWSLPYDELCYCQGVVAPRSQKRAIEKKIRHVLMFCVIFGL